MQQNSAPGQHILFAAPHRSMFFGGTMMLLASFGLWGVELVARLGWIPALPWGMPAGWAHAMLVTSGVFPFYMFGFLLTAMPRWQAAREVPQAQWLWAWRALVAGWGLTFVGFFVPGVIAFGLVLVMAGWAGVLRILWQVAHGSDLDALHARLICYALSAGLLAPASWIGFALTGHALGARIAIEVAIWACLVPVFVSVCHRMLPFFSSGVIPSYEIYRPDWLLSLLVGCSMLHGAFGIAGAAKWAWGVDAPAAMGALWLSCKWRLLPALKVPLLGMLHVGFLWLGLAMALFAAQGLAALAGTHVLGVAPLHALGVGFFGSVLLAMVSRVTLGHSGGKLVADRLTWGLFLTLEGVVALRILAELVPAGASAPLMLLALLGWLGIFTAWASRYVPIYLRPRSDGRAG